MAIPQRGEAPFPLAGEGRFFRFRLADLAALENLYGTDYVSVIERNLLDGSAITVSRCLKHGLKTRDGDKIVPVPESEIEDIDYTLMDVVGPVMDGLWYAWAGKSYLDVLAEAQARREELERQAQEAEDARRRGDADPLATAGGSQG